MNRIFLLPVEVPSLLRSALLLLCLLSLSLVAVAQETATVCLQCHSAQTGRGGKAVQPWKTSIHAANGISCHDCHGGDPKDAANAMSPARGFLGVPKETGIPAFCGRCHVGIREDYLQSAHGRALGKGGPTCVTCHGSHEIEKVTLELINEKSCSRCHPYERAAKIKAAMEKTEQQIVGIEGRLDRFKGEGVDTETADKSLFAIRNTYHRLFHEVNTARVTSESSKLQGELARLDQSLQKVAEQRAKRKIAGTFVVAGALVAALLFHLVRKTYD
ncbi:cytochrome c3 family protein [Geobacter sp. AOG1]|uniref:cytochrome c3 family protein n=1 Tax=Geobacter sp. AOG1 TaxID=1566346 RepID=UPI001CC35667|nr:cytochrome c3 family protein [Geobacter sp. AOG1]GFE58519.1 cytochrome c [Geobacter sp. AOG1]